MDPTTALILLDNRIAAYEAIVEQYGHTIPYSTFIEDLKDLRNILSTPDERTKNAD